jgi:transcriptional regulator with XRE-family HTH domain
MIRIHSNLSQIELGQKLGLSYQQIQKYKGDKNFMGDSVLYTVANCLNVPIARFFEALPQTESAWSDGCLPEIGERVAFLATSEGRRFVEKILRLPLRLRTRTLALIKLAAGDDDEATKPRGLAGA